MSRPWGKEKEKASHLNVTFSQILFCLCWASSSLKIGPMKPLNAWVLEDVVFLFHSLSSSLCWGGGQRLVPSMDQLEPRRPHLDPLGIVTPSHKRKAPSIQVTSTEDNSQTTKRKRPHNTQVKTRLSNTLVQRDREGLFLIKDVFAPHV